MLLADLRPERAPRPWTEGDADEAGLATKAEVGGAVAGPALGSETAGSMSETMRGGESGDGDAVAEAEAEAGVVLETGAGLLSWVVFVVLVLLVLVRLSTSPSAVASPVLATEDGAGAADGGSSTSAEAIMPATALTAGSMGWMVCRLKLVGSQKMLADWICSESPSL